MDAASSHRSSGRGAPRLLAHFDALERVASGNPLSARTRLERELGLELTERLVCALAGGPRPRLAAV